MDKNFLLTQTRWITIEQPISLYDKTLITGENTGQNNNYYALIRVPYL